jgi:hypothetical protein
MVAQTAPASITVFVHDVVAHKSGWTNENDTFISDEFHRCSGFENI